MFDRPDPYRLRLQAARREPWRDVSQLSDRELLDEWTRTVDSDVWGESWFQRAALGGSAYGSALPQQVESAPVEDLAPKHFIGFEVLDGVGEPYPGLAYVLRGPGDEIEEGTLPASAQIRRNDVPDDDWSLTLRTVDELVWDATAALCGDPVALRGRVTGHADGTEVEIRIFRELRETDDDVIECLAATVQAGQVLASWTYDPNASHAIAGTYPELRFIAELRVPGVPGWAKTLTPVVFALPAVRAARWSRRGAAPGKPVEARVGVVGMKDGSPMTIEIFKQRRDGAQECLATFEGLPVVEGKVAVEWTYEADPEDPLAPNEAECFFVATSETWLDATRTSGPLWISRAVGRKARRKKSQIGGAKKPADRQSQTAP
jgi:hypothetical protein